MMLDVIAKVLRVLDVLAEVIIWIFRGLMMLDVIAKVLMALDVLSEVILCVFCVFSWL